MRQPDEPPSKADDWRAAALSIVPGLGHLYKGHLLPGAALLCFIGPAFLTLVFLLLPATFGLSLILPAFFVALVAKHAFHLPNARKNPGVREQTRRTLRVWLERIGRSPDLFGRWNN